jgi:hypothetical protein
MPLGSSSAAPVTSPGPKIFRTFRTQESRLPGPAFRGTAEMIVSPSAAATLMTGSSLGRPDCFFRAKSEKFLWRISSFVNPVSRHLNERLSRDCRRFIHLREASFLNGKKSLNASQPENYDHGYALDYYRHLGRIVASRLLGFPCCRGLNPPSFGDRCDCADSKARDRSWSVGLEPRDQKANLLKRMSAPRIRNPILCDFLHGYERLEASRLLRCLEFVYR